MINIDEITNEIEGSTSGIGVDLSYSDLYDKIKNARFEEDETLSRGIWERELKKADWKTVENLSFEILSKKSKDLQIVAWLIEALIKNYEFEGIKNSLDILRVFLESFWYTCYPIGDDPNDMDQKIHILTWISENYTKQISSLNLLNMGVCLYDYEYAVEMGNLIKRSPESSNDIINSMKKEGKPSVDEIYNKIHNIHDDQYQNLKKILSSIKNSLFLLNSTIEKISKEGNIVSFSGFLDKIESIERLFKIVINNNETEHIDDNIEKNINQVSKTKNISRSEIYNNIDRLSDELMEIDRHSPSPYVLKLIVSWENKSLLEIMTDLQSGETEAHKLLKILINR